MRDFPHFFSEGEFFLKKFLLFKISNINFNDSNIMEDILKQWYDTQPQTVKDALGKFVRKKIRKTQTHLLIERLTEALLTPKVAAGILFTLLIGI